MKATLTSLNGPDFSQRYRGVFGWLLKSETEKILVHITDVRDNQVVFQTSKSSGFFAYSDKGVMFEFLPVTRGYIPTKNGLFFVTRHAARMWQRGISENNTQISRVQPAGLRAEPVSIASMSNLFEHAISYEESTSEYVKKKQKVCALSPHFAIRNNVFQFMNREAGTVENLTTLCPYDIIKQEVQDLLNRNTWLSSFVVK